MTAQAGRTVAPYGSWRSPITVDLLVRDRVGLGGVRPDGDDLYWLESRASEGGRLVIVRRRPDGRTEDVTPPDQNTRTRVHEYGGGAYNVRAGVVVASNFTDGRLYRRDVGPDGPSPPLPLTIDGSFRYADLAFDPGRDRIVCVREDHSGDGEAVNTIVAVPLSGAGPVEVLVEGADFYAAPRLAPDGARLAWLSWDHPDMPWDATRLSVAELDAEGRPGRAVVVAGGTAESIAQPDWAPDGALVFASDRTGWWNLYRCRSVDDARPEAIALAEAEFADPAWVFGMSAYTFLPDGSIAAAARHDGRDRLLRLGAGATVEIEQPFTELDHVRAWGARVVFVGSSPDHPSTVVVLDPATGAVDELRRSMELPFDPAYVSRPVPIEFPTTAGRTAHALFYPPANPDFVAPAGERPPLVVESHGGPTSNAQTGLDLAKQVYTSRGIAVVDVDYGGSSGYGREYRQRLDGAWGIVDLDDCVNAARFLAERGDVDGSRMAISGASAGGYTTLCALVFREVFAAGASHFGVADLEALQLDTHKFESRYSDRLVGPYPERADLYRERSPVHFLDRIACPVLVTQGADDRVVPPAQAEAIVEALKAKGLPYAYLLFEGEGHGFRRAENIVRTGEAELSFLAQIFGFDLADPIAPVHIENLAR